MTQPQDPSTGLDEQALQAALDSYNQAAAQYNTASQNYDRAVAGGSDTSSTALATASSQLDNARGQLASANRDYSNLLGRLAVSYQANQRAAKDPNEQAMWAAEADKAQSQSALYKAESDLYSAKTQADIDKASATASAALQNAASTAQRVQNTGELQQAQAALANAHLAALPQLTASTIALHTSQIKLAADRGQQAIAYANRAQEQTDVLIPAQAQRLLAQAGYSQAQIDKLNITTPLTADELAAKTNLDVAKIKQIAAQIGKQQVLPYSDSNAPNLDVFQPATGQVSGVPNPAYKNPYLQPLQDRAAAIDSIRNDLAAGKFGTGQQAIDYANQLVDGISQAALYQAQGYTPQQYQQQLLSQGQFGQNELDKIVGSGQSVADQFLNYASKARNLPAGGFSPYSTMFNAMGGNDAMSQARALISQVQPVTDRSSALDAMQKYATAKQLLSGGGQAGQPSAMPGADQSTANPLQAATQNPMNPMAMAFLQSAQSSPGGLPFGQ